MHKAQFHPKRGGNSVKVANNESGAEFEKYKSQNQLNLPDDSAENRLLQTVDIKEARDDMFAPKTREKYEQCVRFINPSDEMIILTMKSLKTNTELPKWCNFMKEQLSIKKNKLHLNNKPFYFKEERHRSVKRTYFNPSFPISQAAIFQHLDGKITNITRKFVRESLKSVERYQRTFPRRRPQNINSKFTYKKPGIIACDCFFPTLDNGWLNKRVVLVICDCWSRYCKVYTMTNREAELVNDRMRDFIRHFMKYNHVPRRIICDKGGEFARLDAVMERFRKPGEKGPMVLNSQSGTPVNYVENLNSQIQRMMAACGKLTAKPEEITHLVAKAINHQKRERKGNLSPIELLRLNKREIAKLNRMFTHKTISGVPNLPELNIGDRCRLLMMTRKEQVSSLHSYHKGFAVKWSKQIYLVLRKTRLRKNHDVYNYYLDPPAPNKKPRYRHELLKIVKRLDTEVPYMKKGSLKPILYH